LLNTTDLGLACGLFAFIGTDPEKYFQWDKFNILGWFNDSRGGDACGRIVGNICQHGIDELKTYKEFAMAVKNPVSKITENTILGHTRKASSGGKDSIYAQPIVLYKKDVNMKAIKNTQLKGIIKNMSDNDIVCSGIHNGTIDNYTELAPKYGIPTEYHNDSKVLLNILFYGNYEVLKQYVGTAALIWRNHITNKTYIFKGSSKNWITSTTDSEERPLYYWMLTPDNMYISSVDDSLLFIGATKDSLVDIECNILYTFKEGSLVATEKFDRRNMHQNETYNTSKRTPVYGYRNNRSFNENNFLHKDYYHESSSPLMLPITFNKIIRPLSDFVRLFDDCKDNTERIQTEKFDIMKSKHFKRAYYNKGRYWMNGNLMHGIYLLNSIGMVPSRYTREATVLAMFYMVEGIMMDNFVSYQKGIELHQAFIQNIIVNFSNFQEIEQKFAEDISPYAKYPIASLTKYTGPQDFISNIFDSTIDAVDYFTGNITPYFSNRKYVFHMGDLVSITENLDADIYAPNSEADRVLCDIYTRNCTDTKKSNNAAFTIGHKLLMSDIEMENPMSPFQSVLFSTVDLYDKDINTRALLICYFRDFSEDLKAKCEICTTRNTKSLSLCTHCTYLKNSYDKITTEINYDVYE
jgi:hypothetical protein